MKNMAIIVGNISFSAGTERAVTNLSNLLVKYGNYFVLIISVYSANGDIPSYELDSRVCVKHLNIKKSNKLSKTFSYLKFIKQTKKIIKDQRIDFIIGTTHAFNCLLLFLGNSVIKIACEHMNYNACPYISSKVRKMIYPKLNAVVLLTKADAYHYSFIDPKKRFVIPNSLSFSPQKTANYEKKRIISIGRLTEQKGFDILIKLASELCNQIPDWRIDIFGDGEDKQKLNELIKRLKLEKFIKINSPTNNIQEEFLNSSIYVMTSRWEGLPMVLLEAKSCGLPIVSFDCPEGPADAIEDGIDGYLVQMGNNSEFIRKLLVLCQNETFRAQFGIRSKINSKKFSPETIFDKWNNLFISMENK